MNENIQRGKHVFLRGGGAVGQLHLQLLVERLDQYLHRHGGLQRTRGCLALVEDTFDTRVRYAQQGVRGVNDSLFFGGEVNAGGEYRILVNPILFNVVQSLASTDRNAEVTNIRLVAFELLTGGGLVSVVGQLLTRLALA